uniref:Putative secreted protein n=1 Tax=Rhipicephalus microplus TaxID=6941 RepID=A0A6M2DDV2_RHIMP
MSLLSISCFYLHVAGSMCYSAFGCGFVCASMCPCYPRTSKSIAHFISTYREKHGFLKCRFIMSRFTVNFLIFIRRKKTYLEKCKL